MAVIRRLPIIRGLRRRKPKPVEVDYIGAIREAGYLYDRVKSIGREAEIAAAVLDVDRLEVLRAEQDAVYAQMQEVARRIGVTPRERGRQP